MKKIRIDLYLPIDVVEMIQKTAEEEKRPFNDAAATLIRHGKVRFEQVAKSYTKLAPTDDDLQNLR